MWIARQSAALALTACLGLASLALTSTAMASDLGPAGNELRLGVLVQNAEGTGSEHGNNVNAEFLFASPFKSERHDAWASFFQPRPHIGATYNVDGATNKVYAGLTWNFELGHGVFIESSFGAAWHDGILDDPLLDSFGCPVNFRESVALGYHVTQRVSVSVMVDHMSNANLCNRNRGLTNAGVRIGYALD